MKRTIFFITLVSAFVTAAQAAPPCSEYSGQAKTQCLKAEMQASQQRIKEIDRKNRNLDIAIGAAKVGVVAGAAASAGAGYMVGGYPGARTAVQAYGNTAKVGAAAGRAIDNARNR